MKRNKLKYTVKQFLIYNAFCTITVYVLLLYVYITIPVTFITHSTYLLLTIGNNKLLLVLMPLNVQT